MGSLQCTMLEKCSVKLTKKNTLLGRISLQENLTHMGIYGYIWVHMGIYGYIWVCMGIYGYIWVYMDTFMGYIFGIYGYIWLCMGIYGCIWVYIDTYMGYIFGIYRIYIGNTLEDIIRENSHLYVCDQQMDYGDQCDFTTKSKKDLKTHRKLYFECDICLFRTRSIHNVQELEEHMKKKHNLPEICTIFQCRCKNSGPLSILIEQG